MAIAFQNIKIQRIIVHEVLHASALEDNRQPSYSDAFMQLDAKGSELLNKRLTDAMGSESHSVELNVEQDSEGSPFDFLTRLLDADDPTFIRLSKDLAMRLTSAQVSGSIKSGLAVFADGTMGRNVSPNRFVAVLKAESESAFIKESNPKGLFLKFISDTVLGAQQRLFKIGCFVEMAKSMDDESEPSVRAKEDFGVIVYDHQMSNTGDSNAARYFYSTFLGCRLADNAPRLTRIFYDETTAFINSLNISAEKRLELRNHLISYLKSQETHFSVKEFADRYLHQDQRKPYGNRFKKRDFPSRKITKDIKPITRRLQTRRMLFSSKVRISAPGDDFSDLVKIVAEETQSTTVKIKGRLQAET